MSTNQKEKKNAIIIVLDSVGVGELPDADKFGDVGSDTLGHIIQNTQLKIPNLQKLGIYNIENTSFFSPQKNVSANFGKAAEKTLAKDTTCGHWEMAGLIMDVPFKTFPNGFSEQIIQEFCLKTKTNIIGNCVASGTKIIEELGDKHVETGFPIIYTSADSVFQIAAHEDIIPLEKLYKFCEIAREMLVGENSVGRVIARPFVGTSGNYTRSENRKDYALEPPKNTVLDSIIQAGLDVYGIGKIEDIFCHRGVNIVDHTKNNKTGIEATIKAIKSDVNGLVFSNLVDFDMLYGHRNDVEGYAKAIEAFDQKLPEILEALNKNDLLIITADHGCDPAFPGTDHTREYIPIIAFGKNLKSGINIGQRNSFADIGATVHEFLGLGAWDCGESFLSKITK